MSKNLTFLHMCSYICIVSINKNKLIMKMMTIVFRKEGYEGKTYPKGWNGIKEFLNEGAKISGIVRFESDYSEARFNWHGESYNSPMTAVSYTACNVTVKEQSPLPKWVSRLLI